MSAYKPTLLKHELYIRTEPVLSTTPDKSMVVQVIHEVYIRTKPYLSTIPEKSVVAQVIHE